MRSFSSKVGTIVGVCLAVVVVCLGIVAVGLLVALPFVGS